MRYLTNPNDNRLDRLNELVNLQWQILGSHIHLIASACYPFNSVLKALAEPSQIFPAEGMPGARYLPGSSVMDMVELEGEQLVLDLFSNPPDYCASLQPHSGTQANQIVYNAVIKDGDEVLCLRARDGGHISHTVLIGRRNKAHYYGLTAEGAINYDQMRDMARLIKPKLIIAGGSALPRQIDFKLCGEIARECGADLHADVSHTATFIAAGAHQSPFPDCDFVTFNTVKNLRGPNAGVVIYRKEKKVAISRSIFPNTQGGANENNMLGKFTAFLEWKHRSIHLHSARIIKQAQEMADVFLNEGVTLTTGGTDCHILLLELAESGPTGADFERSLEQLGVLVNKNLIPNDKRQPLATSGIRIGTTNLAILDYSLDDTRMLAKWIARHLRQQVQKPDLIRYLTDKYHLSNSWQTS